MSAENTEEIRILEQQELAFWRGTASKRVAGWTRDGSTEEIASWTMEAQRLTKAVEGANTDIRMERLADRKEFGTVECCDRPGVFESVELERGWTVRGFNGHFPVADFDAHRLGRFVGARMFQKAGWSECWCTRIIHAVRTLRETAMSSSHGEPEMERTIVGRASRWTAVELDGQVTLLSAHMPHRGKTLGEFESVLT